MSDERIEGYRHFVNKLWNASRFTLMNLEDWTPPNADDSGEEGKVLFGTCSGAKYQQTVEPSLADAWILSRIADLTVQVEENLEQYYFDRAAGDLYQFVWHEFCDWYLELIKPVLYGEDKTARRQTQSVLAHVLSVILRLLHPIMPFVTEEIWSKLPGTRGSVMMASFPGRESGCPNPEVESMMQTFQGVVTAVRNIRGEMNVPPSVQVETVVMAETPEQRQLLENQREYILSLIRGKSLLVSAPGEKPKGAAAGVSGNIEVFVLLKGLIDIDEEARRLQKELDKVDKDIAKSNNKLANQGFLAKAPAEVVAREKEKVETLTAKREKLVLNLHRVEELRE